MRADQAARSQSGRRYDVVYPRLRHDKRMKRRRFNSFSAALLAASCSGLNSTAHALALNDLTNAQASQGLKLALEKGAIAAVELLGQPNGFLGNDKVRIPLPGFLQDTARLLRSFGQGARLDELIVAMNHAAETAVPLARDMLVGAVKTLNVHDAKKILTGGDTSATHFFAEKTRQPLSRKFLPVVTEVTSRAHLADQYNRIAGRAAGMGLLKGRAGLDRAVRHRQNDRWTLRRDWRRREKNQAGSGRHWQRPVAQSLWRPAALMGHPPLC